MSDLIALAERCRSTSAYLSRVGRAAKKAKKVRVVIGTATALDLADDFALCAAALRARASQGTGGLDGGKA